MASTQATAARPGSGRKGDISTYMAYVNDFTRLTQKNRTQQLIDEGYYHGKQLTTDEVAELNRRNQPVLIINRTRAAVNGFIGVAIQQNTQPRAWPRTQTDEDSADVATDILRYLTDETQLKAQKGDIFENLLNTGVGGVILGVEGDHDATITPILWNELIYDPRSRKNDFSDAKYMGIAKWVYSDDVKAMYPDSPFDPLSVSSNTGSLAGLTDAAGADRPFSAGWIAADKKRIMIVELYYREGQKWYKCVFTAAGVLEEGESWLYDDKKRSLCPIIAESIYVDGDNNRYGIIRDMRPLQDEINKRRSKLLHLLNVAQIQAKDPSAIEVDADAARIEAARADGVIPFGWERVRNQDIVQGQTMLLAESKSELERFAPNPAILGRQGSETSGKALAARQDAGMTELAPVFTRMDHLELRIYRNLWHLVKIYWTGPMVVRVTDEVDDPRFIGINTPVMGQVPGVDPTTGQPAVDPATGGPVMVQDVLGYKNKVADLDVDIILDVVPGTANLMAEQLGILMDLIARNPQYASVVPPEVLFELTAMPRKREIMDKVKAATAAQQQQQAQTQAHEMALAQGKTQAEINVKNTQATLNNAKAQGEGVNAYSYAQQVQQQGHVAKLGIAEQAQNRIETKEIERQALALQQQQIAQTDASGPQ